MITQDETPVKPQWYDCDACGGRFQSSSPPDGQQKLYELHGCAWGKRKAQQDNATCKHCGAVTGLSRCDCPEDILQRKADADASDKKNKEDNARYELNEARYKKEREDKERQDKFWNDGIAASRKVAQRDQLDAELRDREQALKGRELKRSERRFDNYDAAAEGGQVEDGEGDGEPLSAFEMPMDGSDLDLAPTAMLQRKDGAPLLY